MATAAQKIATQLKTLKKLMDVEDALRAKLKPVCDKIEALRDKLINEFTAAELSSTTAEGLRVTRTQSSVPTIVDHIKFFAYASKKANWDLLKKGVSTEAWRERLEAKKAVPGVEPFNRVGLSVTRIKGKK
jgi:hypothetical protein